MEHNLVKDVMKKSIVSIDSTMTVKDAAIMMADANVGCIVITRGNAPIGILTERDFVKRIVSAGKDFASYLADIMSFPIITVKPNDTVWEAAEIMKINKIRRVAVQDQGKLVGIVTTTDLAEICSWGSDLKLRRICAQMLLRMKGLTH